ncbi:unnamed protein product, partial [Polarella glacialis]
AAPVLEYVEKEKPETATEKRIRTLRKKLREIEALQERIDSGESSMNPDMAAKLSSKPVIEREIEGLKQLAALEAHEAEKQATVDAAAAAEKAAAAEAAAARAAVSEAAAEAALAKKRREALEVLANISPTGEEARSDPRLKALLSQVAVLSTDVFHENCLTTGVSKKSGWRLTLLAR